MADTVQEKTVRRFWGKVDIRGPGECWNWQARRNKQGYGHFYVRIGGKPKTARAHRFAYQLVNGPIPDGMLVLHHCDNPSCCNPTHLFLGTHADNVADMWSKNRGPSGDKNGRRTCPESNARCGQRGDEHWARRMPERLPYGERNGAARLSKKEIMQIRSLYASGKYSQKELGIKFGLTRSGIGRIVRGEIWKENLEVG